ncbi:MAG: thiamine phosphate synthase, partial [Dokdonella sp.]
IIGVSCYDSLERAEDFTARGADYLAFGAFFPSGSKHTPRRATPQMLADARRFGLPLVAIGGIDAGNAAPLISAGADCIAVISALFGANDVEAQARHLSSLFGAASLHAAASVSPLPPRENRPCDTARPRHPRESGDPC